MYLKNKSCGVNAQIRFLAYTDSGALHHTTADAFINLVNLVNSNEKRLTQLLTVKRRHNTVRYLSYIYCVNILIN